MTNMLWGFQSPFMLIALLGILVPIAIHIFSKSKGRRIAFGSVKFIKQSKPVKMTQLRLVKPLLLLLRILLVIVSVLFLAQFYLTSTQPKQEQIIFVSEDWLNSSTLADKKQLLTKHRLIEEEPAKQESTKRQSTEQKNKVYLLNSVASELFTTNGELIALSKDEVLNWHNTSAEHISKGQKQINESRPSVFINLWAMLDHAIKSYDTQSYEKLEKFVVYSTDRLNQFYGDKLPLSAKVDWQILKVNNEDVDSKPTTIIKPLNLTVIVDDKQDLSSQNRIDKISTGEETLDYEKLQKALNIITLQYRQISVNYSNSGQFKGQSYQDKTNELTPDWIFYLSKQAVPHHILNHVAAGASLFVPYKGGLTLAALADKSPTLTPALNPINIQQPEINLPHLQIHRLALGTIYSLNQLDKQHNQQQSSHKYLNNKRQNRQGKTAWHNLLQQNYLPQVLVNLLTRQQQAEYWLTNTSLTTAQIVSEQTPEQILTQAPLVATTKDSFVVEEIRSAKTKKNTPDTQFKFFVLLLVIWALERLISEFLRNQSNKKHKTTAQKRSEGYPSA